MQVSRHLKEDHIGFGRMGQGDFGVLPQSQQLAVPPPHSPVPRQIKPEVVLQIGVHLGRQIAVF